MTARSIARFGFANSTVWGFVTLLAAAFTFSLCGPSAKAMMLLGWSPGAALLLRVTCSALVMLPFTLFSLRGRWRAVRKNLPLIIVYGLFGFAGMQGTYFLAAQHISVTLTQLLQSSAPVLVVLWLWVRTGRAPAKRTFAGIVLAFAGMVILLDPFGQPVNLFGVAAALVSAVCALIYFLASAKQTDDVPTLAYIGLSMLVGSATTIVLGATGIMPLHFVFPAEGLFAAPDGVFETWWWHLLVMVAASIAAYIFGVVGIRQAGPTVGSFVSFTEVPFTALTGFWILRELPTQTLLLGGLVLIAGIALVKWGDVVAARRVIPPTTGSIPVQ